MAFRFERVDDLFFEDRTAQGSPSEEGVVRMVNSDLVAYLGGAVKSLTLPTAAVVGQVLYSLDGAVFTVQTPLTSSAGWLTNDLGELLVVG